MKPSNVEPLFPSPSSCIVSVFELEPKDVLVLGYDKTGEFFFRANFADGGEALWLMEVARHRLMQVGENRLEGQR